jgi:CRISPR-associated protein Cas5d
MLYDLDFSDLEHPSPQFFRAVMRDGHIDVAAARGTVIG